MGPAMCCSVPCYVQLCCIVMALCCEFGPLLCGTALLLSLGSATVLTCRSSGGALRVVVLLLGQNEKILPVLHSLGGVSCFAGL